MSLLGIALLFACKRDVVDSYVDPYDDLTPTLTLSVDGLDGPVDIVRDRSGIPHVRATTLRDAGVGYGYVQASDRAIQVLPLRQAALGRAAVLAGGLVPDTVTYDVWAATFKFEARGQAMWDTLLASDDPDDQALVAWLDGMSSGINRWLARYRAGEVTMDPALALYIVPELLEDITPAQLLAMTYATSFLSTFKTIELERTGLAQASAATFDDATDPTLARRAGAFADLFRITPVDPSSTLPGFPLVDGTRSAYPHPTRAPFVDPALIRGLRPYGHVHALPGLPVPGEDHSNNWVVSGALSSDGRSLMAADPHGDLEAPNRVWPAQVTVPGVLDVFLFGFGGASVSTDGFTMDLAWTATTSNLDTEDWYLETIVQCATGVGDCVVFGAGEVPLETRQVSIEIGLLGNVTRTETFTLETVPHHGPILPLLDGNGHVVPRTGNQAISVRYIGDSVTTEARALFKLFRATDVDAGLAALEGVSHSDYNFALSDAHGDVAYTAAEALPWRSAGCFDGPPPWSVLPADGRCEWEGAMPYDAQARVARPTAGWLATANGDPVGATADGDPANDGTWQGHTLYLGSYFEPGWRIGRITERMTPLAARGDVTLDDLADVQIDARDNFAARVRDSVVAAARAVADEREHPGAHADLSAWVAGLDAPRVAALSDAADRLDAWDLGTPTDSAGEAIFAVWAVNAVDRILGDELDAIGSGLADRPTSDGARDASRALVAILTAPDSLVTGLAPETGQPVLCDALGTEPVVESCTLQVATALDDALLWLASPSGLRTADSGTWRWGDLHRLTLLPLLPAAALEVPTRDVRDENGRGGFANDGTQFTVDNADYGWDDLDFAQRHGPDLRLLVALGPDGPEARLAYAGGIVADTRSSHWRDWFEDTWLPNTWRPMAVAEGAIHDDAEERWVLSP